MWSEELLRRLAQEQVPLTGARERVRRRVREHMSAPSLLLQLRAMLTPKPAQHHAVLLSLRPLLAPAPAVGFAPRALTWTAACLVIAMAAGMSPLFLLTPTISAHSQALLFPTRGESYVCGAETCEELRREQPIEHALRLKTAKGGELTIAAHDDWVARFDGDTEVTVNDTSDRPTAAPAARSTLTVVRGRVWVQGLVPLPLRGITIATPHGTVVVQEGSVSVQVGESTVVTVWDRRANVQRPGGAIVLTSGERVQLVKGGTAFVRRAAMSEQRDAWPSQNLARDSARRKEIAQWQHEQRAAQAGILPTSPALYAVKRFAERADVALTIDPAAKVQKQLAQAQTRLSEAAALLAEQQPEEAAAPLEEYQQTLLTIAAGSGGDAVTQSLLRDELSASVATLSAALPDDDGYLLKKTVLEAATALPPSVIDPKPAEGILLVDALDQLVKTAQGGDGVRASETFAALVPTLEDLKNDPQAFSPDVRKEASALLQQFAAHLATQDTVDPVLRDRIAAYVPAADSQAVVLSEEEILAMAQSIRERVFRFHLARSRQNQLRTEIAALKGNPYEGAVLRRLYMILPDGPDELPRRVRIAIIDLRSQRAAEL